MASKGDIVECVADALEGVTKKAAAEAVDAVIDCIIGNLTRGERVQIPGFGTFNISERAAREGRNPATGKPMHIPASKSVRFKPGKALKDAVN